MSLAEWAEALRGRIEMLAIQCDPKTPERLAEYHELLCEWNERMNLTGDTEFDEALDRHYTDSLAPLSIGELFQEGESLIDVGSGAGFPGLPLAIARPDLRVTLLDSLQKRISFLAAVTDALGLTNVTLVHARAEDAGRDERYRERYDIAVARAVAPLPVLCELLLPFVRVGGKMICYKGPASEEELADGTYAAELLGGGTLGRRAIALPMRPDWRHCVLWNEKERKTVRQYPRKAGTPVRKPLYSSAAKPDETR